nr:hypothetical protein [Tanacetum cinerariifolium]
MWKLVQERFQSSEPKNFSDDFLLDTLKTMFEKSNVEASIYRDQRGLVLKVVLLCLTKRTMCRGRLVFSGDANREIIVTETFHLQTDDELSDKELNQLEADDQAIQTILLGLPEDIYAAVDSCETAQEIWLRLMNDSKRNEHFPEKIASNLKFLNKLQPEWSRHVTIVHQTKDLHTADYTQLYDFLKYNQKEVDELKAERIAKTQDPLALMANTNNPYVFPSPHQDQSSFNQNYLQQPMTNPKDITDPTTAMNMALTLMAKSFKPNYSTPTNNNQRISSNPRNRQIAQPVMNIGYSECYSESKGSECWKSEWFNWCSREWKSESAGQNGHQIRRKKAGIQLQAEEYDLMAVAADLDEIKEVNANCILMANLQQASTSGTQTYSTPVYDIDGSAEDYSDCEVSRALSFSFTRASHPQLQFGNPILKFYRLTFSFGLPHKWP